MEEILIKSHLIISDIHNEYEINWTGSIVNTKPRFENGLPTFIIVGGNGRTEINTTDMTRVERCAKSLTRPKGRTAITSDVARIYILEEDGNEKLLGTLRNTCVKEFSPMFDTVGWR